MPESEGRVLSYEEFLSERPDLNPGSPESQQEYLHIYYPTGMPELIYRPASDMSAQSAYPKKGLDEMFSRPLPK